MEHPLWTKSSSFWLQPHCSSNGKLLWQVQAFSSQPIAAYPEQSNVISLVTLYELIDKGTFNHEHLETLGIENSQIEPLIIEYAEFTTAVFNMSHAPLGNYAGSPGLTFKKSDGERAFSLNSHK